MGCQVVLSVDARGTPHHMRKPLGKRAVVVKTHLEGDLGDRLVRTNQQFTTLHDAQLGQVVLRGHLKGLDEAPLQIPGRHTNMMRELRDGDLFVQVSS